MTTKKASAIAKAREEADPPLPRRMTTKKGKGNCKSRGKSRSSAHAKDDNKKPRTGAGVAPGNPERLRAFDVGLIYFDH